MNAFLRQLGMAYVDICRFRQGPQDLPAYPLLLWISLVLYILSLWLIAVIQTSPALALLQAVVSGMLVAVVIYPMLWLKHLTGRAIQTISAIAGSEALFNLLSWPLLRWFMHLYHAEMDFGAPLILLFALLVWQLAVLAHIFRHALSLTPGWGFMAALAYAMATNMLMRALFPPPGTEAE